MLSRAILLVLTTATLVACDGLTGPELVRRMAEAEDALIERGDETLARNMLGPAAAFASPVEMSGLPGTGRSYALVVEYRYEPAAGSGGAPETTWTLIVWRSGEHSYLSLRTYELPARFTRPDHMLTGEISTIVPPPAHAILSARSTISGNSGQWYAVSGRFDAALRIDAPLCPDHTIVLMMEDDDIPDGCGPAEYEIEFDGRFRELDDPSHAPYELLPGERRIRIPRQRIRGVLVVTNCSIAANAQHECPPIGRSYSR